MGLNIIGWLRNWVETKFLSFYLQGICSLKIAQPLTLLLRPRDTWSHRSQNFRLPPESQQGSRRIPYQTAIRIFLILLMEESASCWYLRAKLFQCAGEASMEVGLISSSLSRRILWSLDRESMLAFYVQEDSRWSPPNLLLRKAQANIGLFW